MANGWKHCCDLNGSTFTIFIKHFEGNYVGKSLFLVIHKILGLFVNTLTADKKHYPLKRHNLAQPIQIQRSQKQKTFSKFFFAFLKSILNYKHLPKKHDPYS